MRNQRMALACVAALVACMSEGYAGPCSDEIDSMQARVDTKLDAVAGSGLSAPQSSQAQLHRQPTPGSIAEAEARLGELSVATVEAVKAAMVRAREADAIGDKAACEQALAEVRHKLGQ
jgi:hypothetical protein